MKPLVEGSRRTAEGLMTIYLVPMFHSLHE